LDRAEYSSNERSYSRDYFLDIFSDEIESRLKNEPSFYSRKTKKITIPTGSLIIFSANNQEDLNLILPDADWFSQFLGNDDIEKGMISLFFWKLIKSG
jgi:hypothetical protein